MKYIIAIMTTILIIYLFQTTINGDCPQERKIKEYKNYFWDNKLK